MVGLELLETLSNMNSLIVIVVVCTMAYIGLGAPILDISKNVRSEMVLVHNPNALEEKSGIFKPSTPESIGEGLDLFYRYGFFSLSVRVVPRKDPGSWLIREPTVSMFVPGTTANRIQQGPNVFEPNFEVFLCDDVNELMEAYFKDFEADGVTQPYKMYTASWRDSVKAKYFGLSEESFDGDSGFILVKMNKVSQRISTEGTPSLLPEPTRAIEAIQEGNPDSVTEFVHKYGSHYIKEVVVGESIYQIFAMTRDQYRAAKSTLEPHVGNVPFEYNDIYESILAPWSVRETGSILAASGDQSLIQFLQDKPIIVSKFTSSPNIFEFAKDPKLMGELESLSDFSSKAIIGIRFGSLELLVPSIRAREYYSEVMNTQMTLWEVNIS